MIQPINNRQTHAIGLPSSKDIVKSTTRKGERLNIYEEYLQVISPTYSSDIADIMKQENIQETTLNAQIVETMYEKGIQITKDSLTTIVNGLQEEHIFSLFQQGYSLDKLTIDIIAKEMIQGESISFPQGQEEDPDSIEKDLIQLLTEAGLPANEKNIQILQQYKNKIKDIIQDSDIAISNMLRHQLPITINNLYTARHKGSSKASENDFTEEEIIAVLNMNGIKVSQNSIHAARSLMKGSIEITKQSIKEFVTIKNTISHLNSEDFIIKAALEMKKGHHLDPMIMDQAISIDPGEYSYKEIQEIIEDLKHIDEHVIVNTYDEKMPITIGNLQETLHKNIDQVLHNKNPISSKEKNDKIDLSKRQIEEIRLSLTLSAALKLNQQLDIKTSDLTQIVEELKEIEKQYHIDVLENTGTPLTEENLEAIEQTSRRLYYISHNKEIATAHIVKDKTNFTLEAMDQAISLQHAQASYEEIGTQPERRFKESIATVEEQITHVLEINNIEPTHANIKAAKALIENNIDISEKDIEKAKEVLLKIERILHDLRPAVTAQILQKGIRPDIIHIDDLILHIRDIQQETIVDPSQKVAEAILELDQRGQLSPQERDGLIATYRMLHTITKNETAAIGFLLDHDKQATLGNLFEASKYIKKIGSKTGKIDITIDDHLGIREGDLPTNIRSLIEQATTPSLTSNNINQWIHTKNIVDQWLSRISPEELKTYLDKDKFLEDLVLKDDRLAGFEIEKITKQIKSLDTLSPRTLEILKEHKVALTIPNLYWADKILKNPYILGDMLKDYETLTGEQIDSSLSNHKKDSMESILNKLEEELAFQKPQLLSAAQNTHAYNLGKDLEQMLTSQKQLAENEGIYQVPIQLHHGISNLNIYITNDKNQSQSWENKELKAYMSIKTQNLGVIQVNMRLSDKAVAFEMIGESSEVTFGLETESDQLKSSIEEIGYKVMEAKFLQGQTNISIGDEPKASDALLKYRFNDSKFEHII